MSEIKKCCNNCNRKNDCGDIMYTDVLYCDLYLPPKQTKKIKLYAYMHKDVFEILNCSWSFVYSAKDSVGGSAFKRVPSEDKEVEICE